MQVFFRIPVRPSEAEQGKIRRVRHPGVDHGWQLVPPPRHQVVSSNTRPNAMFVMVLDYCRGYGTMTG